MLGKNLWNFPHDKSQYHITLMRIIVLLCLVFSFLACKEQERKSKHPNNEIDATYHAVNAFGHVKNDTTKFLQLKCGLWMNNQGVLAFRTIDRSHVIFDSTGKEKPYAIYLTTIWGADETDTINGGIKEVRYVVDTASFQIIGAFNFKDKNHIYDFNPMLDGGTVAINTDADLKTFRVLDDEFYAIDKKHCFYRGNIIEGADVHSFRILDTGNFNGIAFDKNDFYQWGDKMSEEDIREKNLDSVLKTKKITR